MNDSDKELMDILMKPPYNQLDYGEGIKADSRDIEYEEWIKYIKAWARGKLPEKKDVASSLFAIAISRKEGYNQAIDEMKARFE